MAQGQTTRSMGQRKHTEINLRTCGHLLDDRVAIASKWQKDGFSLTGPRTTGISYEKNPEYGPVPCITHKNQLKANICEKQNYNPFNR